jgi:hypothetical protein
VGIAAATVVLAIAGVIGVIAFFNARDDATVGEQSGGPGQAAPDATARNLEQGNVILVYGSPADRAPLKALAEEIAGPPDPDLVHAGQAILVQRRPGTDGVVAEAYKRRLKVTDARDPQLRAFAERWLGDSSVRD